MITSEQKSIFVEKHCMTARVAGRRNGEKIIFELDCILAFHNLFNPESGRAVVSMHDSFAAKLFPEQLLVCNVIAVG